MPDNNKLYQQGGLNMTPKEKVIATAQAEIGYLEKKSPADLDDKTANAGSANYTKFARDLDALGAYNGKKNGYAWCDMFVDWCFVMALGFDVAMKITGQVKGGYGAGCTSSANYFKKLGRLYTSDPQPGDQIFFTNDGGKTSNHTGLVVEVKDGKVYTIEGNTSSAAGVVANGGCVRAKSYSLSYSKIMGYGRPDWSLVPEAPATETPAPGVYNTVAECPEWSREAVAWAVDSGYIKGDGTGKLQLDDYKVWVLQVAFNMTKAGR